MLWFQICEIVNCSGISPKHDILMAHFFVKKKDLLDLTIALYLQTIEALFSKKIFLNKEVSLLQQ